MEELHKISFLLTGQKW